ncbi:hypothetical protein ARMSODRAFT_856654, partial [Armillaria solidipes]
TPINAREWPVPLPNDCNLNLVRIEMLQHKAEYVWLDVLCLRQQGGEGEDLRGEEWKLDVPTIGFVYSGAPVVCYYSGLGRPLCLKPGYFDSDRCWFNRAWTLQEIVDGAITGGDTGDTAMVDEEIQTEFNERLKSLRETLHSHLNSVVGVASQMQDRVSTNPIDRIAGMAYLLDAKSLPAYYAKRSEEDAWVALVNAMSAQSRAELFIYYPEPGKGSKYWRPSWEEV